MGGIKTRLFVLLCVTLAVVNAQCLTACTLKPCSDAQSAASPADSAKGVACPHEGAPKQPSRQNDGEGCSHSLLGASASEGAKASFQTFAPDIDVEPVRGASSTWIPSNVREPFAPTRPPCHGIVSVTVLRI